MLLGLIRDMRVSTIIWVIRVICELVALTFSNMVMMTSLSSVTTVFFVEVIMNYACDFGLVLRMAAVQMLTSVLVATRRVKNEQSSLQQPHTPRALYKQ